MDLQQWFYILGIAYIVSWLLILVALIIGGIAAYHRYRRLKREVKEQGAFFFAASSIMKQLPVSKIIPIIGAIPLATKIFNIATSKHKKRDATED